MVSKNADLIEVYSDAYGAEQAADEWREDKATVRVRVVKSSVRAAGRSTTVYVVCTWRKN